MCWIINRCIEEADGKTRYRDRFKREFRKVKLYGFLEPVVMVPGNRTKTSHTMKLYKQSPSGLYLGRVGNNNQHLIMTTEGMGVIAHTVRNSQMNEAQILKTLNAHEALEKEDKLDQVILEETSIKPNPDFTKIIAARAAGSRTAWKTKSSGEQKNPKSISAPSPSVSQSNETILTKPNALTDIEKAKVPKRKLDPVF